MCVFFEPAQKLIKKMDINVTAASIGISIVLVGVVTCALRVVNWVWVKPKRIEKCLREQGLNGNPYRVLVGDMKEFISMVKEAFSAPIKLSDDVVPRALPYFHHIVKKYGMLINRRYMKLLVIRFTCLSIYC